MLGFWFSHNKRLFLQTRSHHNYSTAVLLSASLVLPSPTQANHCSCVTAMESSATDSQTFNCGLSQHNPTQPNRMALNRQSGSPVPSLTPCPPKLCMVWRNYNPAQVRKTAFKNQIKPNQLPPTIKELLDASKRKQMRVWQLQPILAQLTQCSRRSYAAIRDQ